jgi:hypothetical protein
MEIRTDKPIARGVSNLMYVGDSDSVPVGAGPMQILGIAVGSAMAATSTGVSRLLWAGLAGFFALRAYRGS